MKTFLITIQLTVECDDTTEARGIAVTNALLEELSHHDKGGIGIGYDYEEVD